MNKVTVTNSIHINRSPEQVWDYTQNWNNRLQWDFTVKSAKYTSSTSPVSVEVDGHLKFKVTYKISDRARLTTLVMSDLNSFFVKGGGGSWKYEQCENGTRWTQNNTLVLRDDFIGEIFRPLFEVFLKITTVLIMKKAKSRIEST